jgi:hypothetical protein
MSPPNRRRDGNSLIAYTITFILTVVMKYCTVVTRYNDGIYILKHMTGTKNINVVGQYAWPYTPVGNASGW